ncbi:MAG: DUF4421 family protein [Spirochaetes bacterium]|nr:DUF4421 family protein [Spirochaetota bacterium]MBX3722986.1 DUF4421 family protein [Turneriella sp.]
MKKTAVVLVCIYGALSSVKLYALADAAHDSEKRQRLTVALGLQFRDLWVSSNDDLFKQADIGYRSNTPRLLNLSAGYGDFSGAVKINIGSMQKDTGLYGKSEALDLQLNYYGERMGVDLFYQNYSGF